MALDRYRDPEENVDERVKDLLGRMSAEEKVAQLNARAIDDWDAEQSERGIGFLELAAVKVASSPVDAAAAVNEVQHALVQRSRLGIPALVHLGQPNSGSLFFDQGPFFLDQGLGLAATFAPTAVRDMARERRRQLRSVGVRLAHSPLVDIGRDPRWQRIESSIGEDPYLAGRMAVAMVRGLQGEALQDGVAAIAKHFVGYGLSVGGLAHAPVHLGRRQLREIFAEPFAAAIRDADLAGVTTAPNSIDGLPASASHVLLTELLRDDLGFDGLVFSDEQALELLVSQHGIAASEADAAVRAIGAGLDVEFPHSCCFAAPLEQAIDAGGLDLKLLNRAVRRVLRLKFRLGLFEEPMVDAARAQGSFATPKQKDLARRLATSSMVLLKNHGDVLPLRAVGRISVIGPVAHSPEDLGWSPQQGLLERGGSTATIRYAKGAHADQRDDALLAEARALAEQSDTVVLVLGESQAPSKPTLDLPASQLELASAMAASQARVVCVVTGVRTYALEVLADQVDALMLAWSPGAQGGAALADLLFGDVSPSGRLPVTLVRHVGQVPIYYNRKAGGRDGSAVDPLFSFGFGLSYSRFEYADLNCPESVDTHGVLRVAFELTNSSEQDSDEVVQIYGRDLVAGVARPLLQLVGFNRVSVPAGETVTCKFRIDLSQFAYFNEAMEFVVEPGDIELRIGSSSDDIRLSWQVRLTGETRILSQRQIVATQATAP